MRNIAMLLSLFLTLAVAKVWAKGKAVCSLLTASDVSAVGATGQGIPAEMPISNGPTKGDTMKLCSWRLPDGGLHMSLAKMPPGMSRDAVLAELNKTYALLKAQGWTEEKKDFGHVFCNLYTPPAGKQDMPATTSCLTDTKGMMVSATTLSKNRIPMEKIKALVDSAAGRL